MTPGTSGVRGTAAAGTGRGAEGDTVVSVEIVRCALPIARPVRIGATVYREREYVALRLLTDAGVEGHAIGYTRGLPLDAMVRALASATLGGRVSERAAVVDGLARSRLNTAGVLGRALGLIDIALWDALARSAGLPLWRLLGGARSSVPVTVVAGYGAAEGGPAAVEAEVVARIAEGFRAVKLHTLDAAVVRAAWRAAGDRATVAVDAGMGWTTVPEAVAGLRPLDDLGLAFFEDPFAPSDHRFYPDLRRALRTPLAAGEDAAGAGGLADLARVVDVLRVDGTASGGFGVVLDAAAAAHASGRTVMTHAFPDLHAHLAGHPAITAVEMIPDDSGVNPVGTLLARRQRVADGRLELSEAPGHGAPLDWDAVVAHARSRERLDLDGRDAHDTDLA